MSATKYKYFIGTTVDSSINDYVKGVMTQTNISMSDACNRATPYAANTFITLVKDGEWHLKGGRVLVRELFKGFLKPTSHIVR